MELQHFCRELALWLAIFPPAIYGAEVQSLGVKVLSVDPGSAAEKAGVKTDDIIRAWSQNLESGEMTSPFTLRATQREHSGIGVTTLRGLRQGELLSWRLEQTDERSWGILATVARTTDGQLDAEIRQLGQSNAFDKLAQHCTEHCKEADAQSGMRSWLEFQTAVWLELFVGTKEAGDFFTLALADSPAADRVAVMEINGEWGNAFVRSKHWKLAEGCYLKALREAQALGPRSINVAFYEYNLAIINSRLGSPSDANALMGKSLNITRSRCPSCWSTIIRDVELMGSYSLQSGDLDAASSRYQEALRLASHLAEDERVARMARTYSDLAVVAEERGDLSAAEKHLFASLHCQHNAETYEVAFIWGNLAGVAMQRRNLAAAERYTRRSLEMQQKYVAQAKSDFEAKSNLAKTLNNLAEIKRNQKDFAGAASLLERALKEQEAFAANNTDLVSTLTSYGSVLRESGKMEAAETALRRGLAIATEINPASLEAAECRFELAQVLALSGDILKAREEHQNARDIRASLSPNSPAYAESLAASADLEEQSGEQAAAQRDYKEAINVLEKQAPSLTSFNNVVFFSSYAAIYSRYVLLLIKSGKTSDAFEALDRSRAKAVIQSLYESHVDPRASVSPQLVRSDEKLEARLVALQNRRLSLAESETPALGLKEVDRELDETIKGHDIIEQQMRAESASYSGLIRPKRITTKEIQSALPPRTVLLEYFLSKNSSYLFALSAEGLSLFALHQRDAINDLASQVRSNWSDTATSDSHAVAQLSQMVLGPATQIIGRNNIIVVADGQLRYLPFGALTDPAKSTELLVVGHRLTVLPSASFLPVLRSMRRRAVPPLDRVAVIADPVFTAEDPRVDNSSQRKSVTTLTTTGRGAGFARLIHTREEAEAIASVTPSAVVALGFKATRTMAKSQFLTRSRIVHLATHAVIDEENPESSGLVFSMVDPNGNPVAGFLTLGEIYKLHFSADLVIMSACGTALGKEMQSEGLISLTWAFFYAGAKSVIASLWQVNDLSTSRFMRYFYTAMNRQHLPAAEALRQAQLNMSQSKDWSSPYFWAGFILVGDAD